MTLHLNLVAVDSPTVPTESQSADLGTGDGFDRTNVARIMTVAPAIIPFSSSQPLAEWHGEVDSIEGDTFVATLRGKIGDGVAGVVEEALIPIADLRADDLPLLQEGAFFRLCVTYVQDRGARRRVTDVVFRRMPGYRREELEGAQESARELLRALRVE